MADERVEAREPGAVLRCLHRAAECLSGHAVLQERQPEGRGAAWKFTPSLKTKPWLLPFCSSGCSTGFRRRAGWDIQALLCLRHRQRESIWAPRNARFYRQNEPVCLCLREWTLSTKVISGSTGTWSPAPVWWIVDFRSNSPGLDCVNLNTAPQIRQTWRKTPIIVASDFRRNTCTWWAFF